VRLVLTNTDRRAFPAGVGLHPYFPVTPDCLLQLPAQTYWRSAADCLPIARELVPPAWDFRAARRVAGSDIDHCFERDTAHPVRIEWPSRAYAVELHCEPIEPFWVVYIPPGAERFCVEPVTHVNNAFALAGRGVAGTGTRQLLPGASLHQRFEFRLIRSGVQL
jgi:aldose 1-epimerase